MPTRTAPAEPATAPAAVRSLVSLLGRPRATVVEHLRSVTDASVAELAELLEISEVATRRHLGVLEDEGLVAARTVNQGRGRPAARYQLTDDAVRLFPSAHDRLASDAMEYLAQAHGRDGLRAFLRWRLERQLAEFDASVTAEDIGDRLGQLAGALSQAGFSAAVDEDGHGFTLTQQHCAIETVAREHPELCAYEAATFAAVLGSDVKLRRRSTMAAGAPACVCCVTPKGSGKGSGDQGTGSPDGHAGLRDTVTDVDGRAVEVVPGDLSTSGSALPLVGPEPADRQI